MPTKSISVEEPSHLESDRAGKSPDITADEEVLERFRKGDATAFDEIVDRYWKKIYAVVHQMLRNQQDAEEITQDAFIRAHRALGTFRGESAFSTWLYRIAINLARNRYWYWWRRKRGSMVSFDQPINANSTMTLSDVISADAETPEDITLTQEFLDRVHECMDLLSPSHREILTLRNLQNQTYEEIADVLSLSIGTVKSRIGRARESLRRKLGPDFRRPEEMAS